MTSGMGMVMIFLGLLACIDIRFAGAFLALVGLFVVLTRF